MTSRKVHKKPQSSEKTTKKTKKVKEEMYIGDISEVEHYQIDNTFVVSGYRVGFHQKKTSILKSLFMWHNESVNVWTHIFGTTLFLGLIIYTIIYMAPPGISLAFDSYYEHGWFADHKSTLERSHSLIKDIKSNQTLGAGACENLKIGFDVEMMELLKEGFVNHSTFLHDRILQCKQEDKYASHNHPEATMFEALEQYLQNAITIIANPLSYFNCYQHLETVVEVLKHIPAQLQNTVANVIGENDEQKQKYTHKIKYLTSIVNYLNTTIHNWSAELKEKIDSPDFDWLDFKPLFNKHEQQVVQYITRVPLFIHMVSAIICMGMSSTYHLFKDYKYMVKKTLVRLDYAGISILIAGSNTPPIYYSLYCDETQYWRTLYMGLIYISCFGCFVVLLVPKFDQPQFIPLRGTMFVICGLLSVVPIYHVENILEQQYLDDFATLPWLTGGGLYILGAVIYMLKIPERLSPRTYDKCGQSHNIFHVLIVLAALVHYWASIQCFHKRQLYQCPINALQNF